MPKITFVFKGEERSGEFDSSTSLLSAAQQLGVPIVSTCGGQPSCTDCRVKILEGLQQLSKPEFDEVNLMGSVSHITAVRLSCQAKPLGDVKVEPLRLQGEFDRHARAEKLRKRQDRYQDDKQQREQDERRERAVREARRQLEEMRDQRPPQRGGGSRPSGQRPDGQRPHGQRPHGQRPHGQGPHGHRPHGQRQQGQRHGGPRQDGQPQGGQRPQQQQAPRQGQDGGQQQDRPSGLAPSNRRRR